jgi:hypothetical protein
MVDAQESGDCPSALASIEPTAGFLALMVGQLRLAPTIGLAIRLDQGQDPGVEGREPIPREAFRKASRPPRGLRWRRQPEGQAA